MTKYLAIIFSFLFLFFSVTGAQEKREEIFKDSSIIKLANDGEFLYKLGLLYLKHKNYVLSQELLTEAFLSNPIKPDYLLALKQLYIETNNNKKLEDINMILHKIEIPFYANKEIKFITEEYQLKSTNAIDSFLVEHRSKMENLSGIWSLAYGIDGCSVLIIKKNYSDSLKYFVYYFEMTGGLNSTTYFKREATIVNGNFILDRPLYVLGKIAKKFIFVKYEYPLLIPETFLPDIGNLKKDKYYKYSVYSLAFINTGYMFFY